MTCVKCKFQWCWLCQKAYDYNHYSKGSCNGLQFYKENDEKKIKAKLEENRKKYPEPSHCLEYFCNFWKCVGYIFLMNLFSNISLQPCCIHKILATFALFIFSFK